MPFPLSNTSGHSTRVLSNFNDLNDSWNATTTLHISRITIISTHLIHSLHITTYLTYQLHAHSYNKTLLPYHILSCHTHIKYIHWLGCRWYLWCHRPLKPHSVVQCQNQLQYHRDSADIVMACRWGARHVVSVRNAIPVSTCYPRTSCENDNMFTKWDYIRRYRRWGWICSFNHNSRKLIKLPEFGNIMIRVGAMLLRWGASKCDANTDGRVKVMGKLVVKLSCGVLGL